MHYTATFQHTYMLNKNLKSSTKDGGSSTFPNHEMVYHLCLTKFLNLVSYTIQTTV
jgi:hypothetical protein